MPLAVMTPGPLAAALPLGRTVPDGVPAGRVPPAPALLATVVLAPAVAVASLLPPRSLPVTMNQAKKRMGMVAIRPHQIGSRRSAMIPRTVKIIQKIFRSTNSL